MKMATKKTRRPTLRGRLLRTVGWPLVAVLLASSFYDYYSALDRATDSQDLALERICIALATRMDMDADDDGLVPHLDRTMAAMQLTDGRDRLHFLILGEGSSVIAGDPALAQLVDPAADRAERSTFADHGHDRETLRVATFPHQSPRGPLTVVVAETTRRRDAQARVVLIDTVTPDLALVVLALGLVYLGVRWGMRPLDRLRGVVAARAPDDLSPLADDGLAGELLPLVRSINALVANLRASAESQQAFLSVAAHQLRTPLAGMQTQIELARKEAEPQQRARLDALHEAMQRIGRSTSQMLALARSGPQAIQAETFATVDLQQLLEESASSWLDFALASQVDLGYDAQPVLVHGSVWMLRELLGNLIHNAIRHSPPQGRVTVRCSTLADGASALEVEDEGPGIPPAERDKVFERFYQAPGAAQGGSGLGLAVVQEVALRHHATVTLSDAARPTDDGLPGLRVSVRFPVAVGASPSGV
ncbi:sensor histidine kinase [Paucibacter sp. R3-3]|uniref:histidine kinase n=1 Tax=Roseateles agri TaxID=3098619 RepID=A0ABU5DDF6_9BURK|nr:sensor histidine kinase [Paucibacter sp. R3-3]MDY0744313.1 sensor histidine kinase [Paucibacter sp. R3-3]